MRKWHIEIAAPAEDDIDGICKFYSSVGTDRLSGLYAAIVAHDVR